MDPHERGASLPTRESFSLFLARSTSVFLEERVSDNAECHNETESYGYAHT